MNQRETQRKMKILAIGFLLISVVLLGAGCMKTGEETDDYIEVEDMLGRTVKVPDKVERVVAVKTNALRLVVYLDAVDLVVGVADIEVEGESPYRYAHPELGGKPVVAQRHTPDPELVTSVNPDVILLTAYEKNTAEADDLQNKTGIPVVALWSGDLGANRADIDSGLRLIGKVLDKTKRAEEVIEYLDSTIEDITNRTAGVDKVKGPRIYIGGVAHGAPSGITSTEPDYQPFQWLKVNNVASGLPSGTFKVDSEQIIEWDPEIIILDTDSRGIYEGELQTGIYDNVGAVENGKVYQVIPSNRHGTNYDIVIANAYYLGTLLYPELFADIDPEDKADDIFEFLVGARVYEAVSEVYAGGYSLVEI